MSASALRRASASNWAGEALPLEAAAAPAELATGPSGAARSPRLRRLVRGLVWTAALMIVLTPLLYLAWGRGTELVVIPWFNAFAFTLQALTCASASVLIFGRHRVLHHPGAYWTGLGFCLYGLTLAFYVATWPGLLADGAAIVGRLPGTAAWFPLVAGILLWAFLFASALARWPGAGALRGGRWLASIAAWLGGVTVLCTLLVLCEDRLPLLVRADGTFTPLFAATNILLTLAFGAGTVVAAIRSQRTADPLPALTAYMQLAFVCIGVWLLIGPVRYGPWWYLARGALTAGALAVLLGLLSAQVGLLRRERRKSARLAAQTAELLAIEAQLRERSAHLQSANAGLREADRHKNEFIAMLSHELRNPLAPISNALFILDRAGPDAPEARRALEVALRQIGHLTRLVDDLLDVTRIGNGKVALQETALDLAALARRVGDDHRPLLQGRGVALAVETPSYPQPIVGDETRLAQAIGNLLQNAAKFTPPAGRVRLAVCAGHGAAEVRVSDTGSGIAPELLEVIFEPFRQGPQTLARTGGGLGLGLALVKGVVELHGGTVSAESPGPDGGALFVLRLPLRPAETPRSSRGS